MKMIDLVQVYAKNDGWQILDVKEWCVLTSFNLPKYNKQPPLFLCVYEENHSFKAIVDLELDVPKNKQPDVYEFMLHFNYFENCGGCFLFDNGSFAYYQGVWMTEDDILSEDVFKLIANTTVTTAVQLYDRIQKIISGEMNAKQAYESCKAE